MKGVNPIVLFLLMLPGLIACTPPKYVVIKRSNIAKTNLDKSTTNYIPISDQDLNKSKLLDFAYNLIVWYKNSTLKSFIKSMEASNISTSDLYLAKTLLFIKQKKYADANVSLGKVKESEYELLKKLLSIDLLYEIKRSNEEFDYNEFLKKYQDLIDSYPNDVVLDKIVLIRMRYLRYTN